MRELRPSILPSVYGVVDGPLHGEVPALAGGPLLHGIAMFCVAGENRCQRPAILLDACDTDA